MKSKYQLLTPPRKKWKVKKRILIISIPILVLAVFFAIIVFVSSVPGKVYTNTDEISNVISTLQPRIIELDNISVIAQPDSLSCGIATVATVSNYFNNTNYDINHFTEKYSTGSSSGNNMTEWLQQEMPGRTILYKTNVTADE